MNMWRNLLQLTPSQALFDWRNAFKELNFKMFMLRFLSPSGGESSNVICPNHKACNNNECRTREVRTISGKLVAYCMYKVEEDRIPLADEDIQQYGLIYSRFHSALCDPFHIQYTGKPLDNNLFWEIGLYPCRAGKLLPVYISYYSNKSILREKLRFLMASKKEPFVVFILDKLIFPRDLLKELDDHNCGIIFLSDSVQIQKDTSFTISDEAIALLERFKTEKKKQPSDKYETPPGTSWKDIHIKAIDNETLSIWRTGDAPRNYKYFNVGLENKAKGCPSLAFVQLLEFLNSSEGQIAIPDKGSKENEKMRHRIHELRHALMQFFPNVAGDPILQPKNGKSYIILFSHKSEYDIEV